MTRARDRDAEHAGEFTIVDGFGASIDAAWVQAEIAQHVMKGFLVLLLLPLVLADCAGRTLISSSSIQNPVRIIGTHASLHHCSPEFPNRSSGKIWTPWILRITRILKEKKNSESQV